MFCNKILCAGRLATMPCFSHVLMIAVDELHNPISWFGLTRVRLLRKKFVAASLSPNELDWLNFPHWCWTICINVACNTQSNKLVSANYDVALLLCVCVLLVCFWHASWNTNYAMWTFVFLMYLLWLPSMFSSVLPRVIVVYTSICIQC